MINAKKIKKLLIAIGITMVAFTLLSPLGMSFADVSESEATTAYQSCATVGQENATLAGITDPNEIAVLIYNARREKLESAGGVGGVLSAAWDMDCVARGNNPEASFIGAAKSVTNVSDLNAGGYTIASIVETSYVFIMPVGLTLMVLYFLIEVLNDVQLDSFNMEKFVKRLMGLAVAILVVMKGAAIFTAIIGIGDGISETVASSLSSQNLNEARAQASWIALYRAGKESGMLSSIGAICVALGYIMSNALIYLLMLVALIVIYVVSYGRLIEICVRFILAPIGCASLVCSGQQGGAHSPGMRYIKKFASCCLQGAVIIAATGASAIIQAMASAKNAGAGLIAMILLPLSLIGFALRSQRVADDVIGVQ